MIEFIDDNISEKSNSYREYVNVIGDITKATPYDYQSLLLNYIKVGLEGHTFNIDGMELSTQSDGTNSHRFLEIFLKLIVSLTRREFITPTIVIDEPEIGLHPKRSEELIDGLYYDYKNFKKSKNEWELGKYKTPYPNIIFITHSPSILKSIVKQFDKVGEHSVFHFTRNKKGVTSCTTMNSYFKDSRFTNVMGDNEARLFFSESILFVEGETELELFGNRSLKKIIPEIKKVDVYKTNEVMLTAINPSNSNVSIPYLVLYDADKMISINRKDGSISYLAKEVDLKKITNSYKFGFWNSLINKNYRLLNNFLKLEGVPNKFDRFNLSFEKRDISRTINSINSVLVENEKIKIAPNTIEGYLINETSLDLFVSWLLEEFNSNVRVGPKGDPNIVISRFKVIYSNDFDSIRCFNAIFGNYDLIKDLTDDSLDFAEKIKRRYIRQVFKDFARMKLEKNEIVNILRIAFEGKSDTLCSKENANYSKLIDQSARDLVQIVRSRIISKLPCGSSKTGGWVTSFLNYTIQRIENESASMVEAKLTFQRAFPQLYGTIYEVTSSIE